MHYQKPDPVKYYDALHRVSQVTGVDVRDITNRQRIRSHVDARHLLRALLYEQGEGWKAIGRFFGWHHATIIFSYRQHQRLFETDKRYRELYKRLIADA